VCAVLSLSTGLQIGAVYSLLLAIGLVFRDGTLGLARYVSVAGLVVIPMVLVSVVVFGFPRLWEGFLEHAGQTPALTGLRFPKIEEVLKTVRTVPGTLGSAVILGLFCWRQRGRNNTVAAAAGKAVVRVTIVSALASLAIITGSLFVLTPNA